MQVSGIKRVQVRYKEQRDPRTYAFDTDLPVKVGSKVLVPGNSTHPGDQEATVANLDSTYGGPVKWIKVLMDDEGVEV